VSLRSRALRILCSFGGLTLLLLARQEPSSSICMTSERRPRFVKWTRECFISRTDTLPLRSIVNSLDLTPRALPTGRRRGQVLGRRRKVAPALLPIGDLHCRRPAARRSNRSKGRCCLGTAEATGWGTDQAREGRVLVAEGNPSRFTSMGRLDRTNCMD